MQTAPSEHTRFEEAKKHARDDSALFGRTVSAFSWRFAAEASRFILQLIVTVILARLVSVDDFGLLALTMVVINLFIRISELGMIQAVIQRKDLTDAHIRVAFTLSTISGIFLTTVIWVGAPVIATVFRAEAVIPVLRLISFTFVFNSFGSTAAALLY